MSAEMKVDERVVRTLADILNIDLNKIHPRSRMLRDLGASSIYITELVAALQRTFRIELTYIEVERCDTVAELVLLVEGRVRATEDP